MERLDFSHKLRCEPQHLKQAAHVVLHTICFHRLLGTIRPAYIDAFSVTFSAVADADADLVVRQRASQLAALLQASPPCTQLELVVYFLDPSRKVPSTTTNDNKSTTGQKESDTKAGSTDRTGMVHTAANAASSLRAWASPRNYQYGWLAHAFSSGQTSGAFVPPPTLTETRGEVLARTEKDAFEKWSVTFELVHRTGGAALTSGIAQEMEEFVDSVLLFVEDNKTHLPPISSADLCPYPMQIVVREAN